MKILFVDAVCWKEHIAYNKYWLIALNEIQKPYDTAFVKGYDKYLRDCFCGGKNIEISANFGNSGYVNNLKFLWRLFFKIHLRSYRYIIFSSINKLAFICSPFFFVSRALLVSHTWQSTITPLYRMLLNVITWRHKLIVLDQFISDFLQANKIEATVIPHPINIEESNVNYSFLQNNIVVFAPSKSTDVAQVEQWFHDKTLNDWLKSHHVYMYVRNKIYNKSFSNIAFSTDYLESQQYHKLFNSAYIILIAYPQTFTNRVSNVFYEAIGKRKRILLLQGTHLDKYRLKYDMHQTRIRNFRDIESLKEGILQLTQICNSNNALDELISEHSLSNMQEHLLAIISE